MDKDKIISHFGMDFYQKVTRDLEKYGKLWFLRDFKHIDYYSVNCIFTCVSEKYGKVVLKIGDPANDETADEYNTLIEYDGKRFCRAYEVDTENCVVLIERIEPGTQLRAESDLDKRLDIFCNLFRGLHIKPKSGFDYDTYMGWVKDIADYMRGRQDYATLAGQMEKAEHICRSLCEKYTGLMLLHGDLHHDNILLGENGFYHIIDPKGVAGDPVFDIPRFILNEFEDEPDSSFRKKISHIIRTLSYNLNVPEADIRKLIYVETCMAVSWSVESGQKPDIHNVEFAEKLLDENK